MISHCLFGASYIIRSMPLPGFVSALLGSIIGSAADDAVNAIANAPTAKPEQAVAVGRAFPGNTRQGELMPPQSMHELVIDQQVLPAAPGLQIRSTQNLIVMPSSLQAAVPVRYQLDSNGAVIRVWLLSRQELSSR